MMLQVKNYLPHLILPLALSITPLSATVAQENEIRFGLTLSLAGGSAPFSQACRNAATMATEEVNSSGGIAGKKLTLLVEDYGAMDLKRAASAATKLISQDKVSIMLTNWSEDTEVVAPIAERNDLLTMTLGAGGPLATRYTPSIFRATTGDDVLTEQVVKDARTAGSETTCVITADSNYYVDINNSIANAWKAAGGKVVYREEIGYTEVDLRSHVTRMRSRGCTSIFAWVSPSSLTSLLRELNSQQLSAQINLPWYGDTPEVRQEAKKLSAKVALYRYVLSDPSFKSRYEERFKTPLLRPAGNCYDGIRYLAATMASVGTSKKELREAMLTAKTPYIGVTGPFTIQPNRERVGEKVERVVLN